MPPEKNMVKEIINVIAVRPNMSLRLRQYAPLVVITMLMQVPMTA